jgi:hypothetical protein
MLESEAQQTLDDLRRQLAERTTSTISSRLTALLNQVPGVSIAYKAQSRPAPAAAETALQAEPPAASEPDQQAEASQV